MHYYVHTITEIEELCGVTMADVQRELPRILVRGDRFIMSGDLSPALASSVARCAAGGRDVEFRGFNAPGYIVYGIAEA